MKLNPISTSLMKTSTRNLYNTRLEQAKNNLQNKRFAQQIERDYIARNIKPIC